MMNFSLKNFDSIIVNNEFNEALQDLKTLMFTEKELTQERKSAVKVSLDQLLD